jgi:hypothetical protein
MLEEKESVVAILKEAMKELDMNRKGRVTFGAAGFDYAALSERGEIITPNFCPRWKVQLHYPIGEEERSKQINFDIITFDFQNEDQIKRYIIQEIKKQMDN